MLTPYLVNAVALLCLSGSAPTPTPTPAATPIAPLTSPIPIETTKVQQAELDCVHGFSKDTCDGKFQPNPPGFSLCFSHTETCSTVRVDGEMAAGYHANPAACGSTADAKCDQTLDGTLEAHPKFTIRLQDNCPYRGCWSADATFTLSDGSVYNGSIMGTLGVGTHRPVTSIALCPFNPGNGGRDCEKCYDVSFIDSALKWRIGYEAAFHGYNSNTGEELCFTMSGDFFIPINPAGTRAPDWSARWAMVGTADGVNITFCP